MPNWIINKLSFEGDDSIIEKLMIDISTEEEVIDFDKIITMPKSLRIESSSSTDESYAFALYLDSGDDTEIKKRMSWLNKDHNLTIDEYVKKVVVDKDLEEFLRPGRTALQNLKNYGHKDWYSWSIENWGTKWNTDSSYINDLGEIVFETAWSTPFPVILELSLQFRDLLFKLKFADESIGCNCGEYHLLNGEVIYQTEYDEVEACVLWGYDPIEMFDYVRRDCTIDKILNEDDNNNSSL